MNTRDTSTFAPTFAARHANLAQRLFNTPLAVAPEKIEIIMMALAERFGLAQFMRADGQVVMLDGDYDMGEPARERPYEIVQGVAVIPVEGTLVAKLGTLHPYSGMTGYDGIRANIAMALADDTVQALVLDIDSPGGELSGCFDLVDAIYSARGEKPMWAILTETAYSAAYALASACDVVTVPRSGGTGSIGVVYAHADLSQALTQAGIAVTLIAYGAHKTEGNEFEPLSKDARDHIQTDIDELGELFVATVARNRGIKPAQVRDTQAATFLGGAGVDIGLADAVLAPDEAFRSLLSQMDQQSTR